MKQATETRGTVTLHLVRRVCGAIKRLCDLIQSLSEEADLANYKPLEIDERWKDIEPDVLADMALETFNMVPGSIWGPDGDDCIVLESFHIGEIEVS